MKRQVTYKQGYKIVIHGNFFEVSDVKRVLYYNSLSHTPTFQEVWNKTIGLEQQEQMNRQRINKGKLLHTNGGIKS